MSPEDSLSQSVPVLIGLLREALQGIPFAGTASDEQVTTVRSWVSQLLGGIARDEPLSCCKGVSCSSLGAEPLYEHLVAFLREAGLDVVVQEDHCLEHCDRGPMLSIENNAFSCAREEPVDDERTWR